jgi:pilus assembly protein CpaE
MSIYFLSPTIDIEKSVTLDKMLVDAIPDLIKIKNIEEIPKESSSAAQHYVLLVASPQDNEFFNKLVDQASRSLGRLFFILISDTISAEDYKRLVRTGGADWVATNALPQEILEFISKRRLVTESASSRRAEPVLISLAPSAGGVGNTTLAVEIASYLKTFKTSRNLKICIVDLDLQSSHVCDYLDIEPRLQIQEISANPERLDEHLFEIYISRHKSGLHIFAAPRTKFNICDLNVLALDSLFNMISTRYDLIIIDLPLTWFSWTFPVISRSDAIIVTGLNTIPGLRQIAETVGAVRNIRRPPGQQIAVVINRYDFSVLRGIARRRHVEKVLGEERVFFVRNDPVALESINAGTPIVLAHASRKINKEIAIVGTFCADIKSSRVAATT